MYPLPKKQQNVTRQSCWAHRWVAMILVLCLMTACSRDEPPPRPTHPEPPPVAVSATVPDEAVSPAVPGVPAATAERTPHNQTSVDGVPAAEPAIRVTALMKGREGPPQVGVVQKSTGYWRMLHIGESFLGYRVVKIHYERDTVLFDWNGRPLELRLEGVVEEAVVEAKRPDAAPANAKLVRGKTKYAPSIDELARNIDPNDASTWPPGYRGPAIERIALEIDNPFPSLTPENFGPKQTFEPTEDELARGINPNDATTWPKGYRGPVIERIRLERGAADLQPAPVFDRTPPEGTPEEIKARFLATHAPVAKQDAGNAENEQ